MTDAEIKLHNQRRASEGLQRIAQLIGNPNFEWFLQECVQKEKDELEIVIHTIETSDLDRLKAVVKWNALQDVKEWAVRERDACGQTLGHAPVKS